MEPREKVDWELKVLGNIILKTAKILNLRPIMQINNDTFGALRLCNFLLPINKEEETDTKEMMRKLKLLSQSTRK